MQKPLLGPPTPGEEWRVVTQYPNYEVSNLGRVRRTTYLRSQRSQEGYAAVQIYDRNHGVQRKIHRLVAEAGFIGPKPSGVHEVNHKDMDRMNPCASNLEWCTRLENSRHSWTYGNRRNTVARGEKSGNVKLTDHQVVCIRHFRRIWRQRSIARKFGVSQNAILQIHAGRVWTHLPSIKMDSIRKGEHHHGAKLMASQVCCIRALHVIEHKTLGKWFRVGRATISLILEHKTWRHLP